MSAAQRKPRAKKEAHTKAGYDPARSILLATASARVYSPDNGELLKAPLDAYRKVGILWLREFFLLAWLKKFVLLLFSRFSFAKTFDTLVSWDFEFRTPFGVVLESKQDFIVALRGTHNFGDAILDISFFQRPVPADWTQGDAHFEKARVHSGFRRRTLKIQGQLEEALQGRDRKKPIYVTGHSLGGAVAVLASLVLKHKCGFEDVRLYSYAGPRVGNPAFVDAYNQALPASYRVVNDADIIPQAPLKTMLGEKFGHVGEKWAFLNQTDDLLLNHGMDKPNNYLTAAEGRIPSNKPWNFPVSEAKPEGAKVASKGAH